MWSDFASSESAELGEKLVAEIERGRKKFRNVCLLKAERRLLSLTPDGCWNVGGEEKCLASQGWKWPKGHLGSRGRIFLEKLLPHCYCSLAPCFKTNKTQKTALIWLMQVILWTLDNGNTINSLELDNSNSECYYFERLERVLATQVSFSHPDSILLSNLLSQNILQSWSHLMTFLSVDGEATLEGGQAEAEVWSAEIQKLHRTIFRGQHVHLQGSKHKKMTKYDNIAMAGWEREGDLRSRGRSWHWTLCLSPPGFYKCPTFFWLWIKHTCLYDGYNF